MGIVSAGQLASLIAYLRSGDARGAKLLRSYYAPVFYGALKGMLGCPEKSSLALEKLLSDIVLGIGGFDPQRLMFFSWAMQRLRSVGADFLEHSADQVEAATGSDDAFSLVMQRGFSIAQASRFMGISKSEVARRLRLGLIGKK